MGIYGGFWDFGVTLWDLMRGSREFMGVKDGLRDFLVAKYGINKILLGIDMGLMGCGGVIQENCSFD